MTDSIQETIQKILTQELSEHLHSIQPIQAYGTVNQVYDLAGSKGHYVIRLNAEDKRLEYQKEHWCFDRVGALGIPTAKVLKIGRHGDLNYMLQEKIPGLNGTESGEEEQRNIWQRLGEYAAIYQEENRIQVDEFEEAAFHKTWRDRLFYNIAELKEDDSLLRSEVFRQEEHERAKSLLHILKTKEFKEGLVHGDLSPRNTIVNQTAIHLIDWGTAEVDVVPHMEIGIVQMSGEANELEFQHFLVGLGIDQPTYLEMERDIRLLNFLHRLDKYRWAEGQEGLKLHEFAEKIRHTFDRLVKERKS